MSTTYTRPRFIDAHRHGKDDPRLLGIAKHTEMLAAIEVKHLDPPARAVHHVQPLRRYRHVDRHQASGTRAVRIAPAGGVWSADARAFAAVISRYVRRTHPSRLPPLARGIGNVGIALPHRRPPPPGRNPRSTRAPPPTSACPRADPPRSAGAGRCRKPEFARPAPPATAAATSWETWLGWVVTPVMARSTGPGRRRFGRHTRDRPQGPAPAPGPHAWDTVPPESPAAIATPALRRPFTRRTATRRAHRDG